ncbi:MAG: hypothetical protein LUD81_07725 [Clostridiales bacterium]|nr:hypothetical protein [Clostridiales bacterium]
MKKIYISPKIEITKINSEDPTAAFAAGNHNSLAMVKAKDVSSAANIINY